MADSVILGDNAYQVIEGFIGELLPKVPGATRRPNATHAARRSCRQPVRKPAQAALADRSRDESRHRHLRAHRRALRAGGRILLRHLGRGGQNSVTWAPRVLGAAIAGHVAFLISDYALRGHAPMDIREVLGVLSLLIAAAYLISMRRLKLTGPHLRRGGQRHPNAAVARIWGERDSRGRAGFGGRAGLRGAGSQPQRCHIEAVITGTMSHRVGMCWRCADIRALAGTGVNGKRLIWPRRLAEGGPVGAR